jgi:hypothetical protein
MWTTKKKILFTIITVHSYDVNEQHLGHVTEKNGTVTAALYHEFELQETMTFQTVGEAKYWIEENGKECKLEIPIYKKPPAPRPPKPPKAKANYNFHPRENMLYLYNSNGYFLQAFYNSNVARKKLNCTLEYLESIYIEDRSELCTTGIFSISKKQFRVPKANYQIDLQPNKQNNVKTR